MKRREWLSLVLSSGLAATATARPRYGGVLRFFPALPAVDREPLSRLASNVSVEADRRTWRIALRPYVVQHDNSPLNASVAAEAIKTAAPTWTLSTAGNWNLTVQTEKPQPNLFQAVDPQFKCGAFEKVEGPRPSLRAFDLYWDRRPYVDAIEVAANPQDADIAELPLAGARRPRSDTHRLWSTAPVETIVVDASKTPGIRDALSAAIDRQSIVKVLFQGRGEAAGGLQPQWESGYAFLFPVQQDLTRARALLAQKPGPFVLGYPNGDALVRQLAERIAVNARDAGLILQVKAGPGDLHIYRENEHSFASYEVERATIEDRKLVPVVHVPRLFAIHSRIRGWEAAHDGKSAEIHPESIWLDS
jgi:MarR-like DNA-binding transcriptional regulator SgrR of sgrS sRNA